MSVSPEWYKLRVGSRQSGSDAFQRLEGQTSSAGVGRLGKVLVDARILIARCQWGTLGPDKKPAGIIYMDIVISEPVDGKLANAMVLVSLEDPLDDVVANDTPRKDGFLQITEWFGPKSIVDKSPHVMKTGGFRLAPSIEPFSNIGGIDLEARYTVTNHTAHTWNVKGQLLSGDGANGPSSSLYRALGWNISQTELATYKPMNSRVIHTAFAFQHVGKPFILKVQINGKTRNPGSRRISNLKYSLTPRNSKDENITLVDPSRVLGVSRPLDDLAQNLPTQMEAENMVHIPVMPEVPVDSMDVPTEVPLSFAAKMGNLGIVSELLKKKEIELEEQDAQLRTALSWAAGNGHLEVARLLLRHNGRVDQQDIRGRTPLSWAAGNGHLKMARLLLEHNARVDQQDIMERMPLSWAAGNGKLEVVRLLLEKGADMYHQDTVDRPPLALPMDDEVAQDPMTALLFRTLLNIKPEGTDDNDHNSTVDSEGRTALAWAAEAGRLDVVHILLQHHEQHFLRNRPDLGTENIPSHSVSVKSTEEVIRLPLLLAAKKDHLSVLRILLDAGLKVTPDRPAWLCHHLHEGIRAGKLSLVRIMFQLGSTVDMVDVESGWMPLCTAAAGGHADIIIFLIDSGASIDIQSPSGETPLFLAASKGREEAVKVLLDVGADIRAGNSNRKTLMEAADSYPTILRMISDKDKDGQLAESDPYPDISLEFNAKVVFFTEGSGGVLKPNPRGMPVSALLENSAHLHAPESDDVRLKWFHLPVNNMRWIEALVFRYCADRSTPYKILRTDRWVGSQHLGDADAHQARFMLPLCESFGPSTLSNAQQRFHDKDMVCFMPYLHWEENKRLEGIKSIIKGGKTQQEDLSSWTKDQKLLHASLFRNNSHPLHLPHIRRTLDQFCYYTLNDTDERDEDQTVIRYQRKFSEEPKVTAMVDQLWMWVLVGPSGRADTVITCFPNKDDSGAQARSGPDPHGFSDVLQSVKLQMLYNPQIVKTAYDLAGIIASCCSRAFLGTSRAPKILQFAEIYESAISNIINQETELFDMFRTLIEARRKDPDPAKVILGILRELKSNKFVDPLLLSRSVQEYYNDTLSQETPNANEVSTVVGPGGLFNMDKMLEILQKLGSFHVLDISREISLLREIKDIQDELNIMDMVFAQQTGVLKEMEKIVRSIQKPSTNNRGTTRAKKLPMRSVSVMHHRTGTDDEDRSDTEDTADEITSREPASTQIGTSSAESNGQSADGPFKTSDETDTTDDDGSDIEDLDDEKYSGDDDVDLKNQAVEGVAGSRYSTLYHTEPQSEQSISEVWGSSYDAKHTSLPISTVQLSVDDIARMAERAAKANQALDFLVDLKQKQSNVMDARSARIQADESFKMTKEAEKQGKTIMVFTIVTIIFLPLSFMAAFFALNITQFPRDEGDTLSLGYVLGVMVPISAIVSAGFIYIAFKADSFAGTIAGLFR